MPKNFPTLAETIKIVDKQGTKLIIEAVAKSFGTSLPVTMETVLYPPRGFISDNTNHKFKAVGYEEFLMEEIPGGTQINYSYEYDISNSNVLLRIIAKPLLSCFSMRYLKRNFIDKLDSMLNKDK